MQKFQSSLIIIVAIILFLAANSIYVVDQRKSAIITQFGKVVNEVLKPG